jgi:L-amino acid N-acyltransferase YncA
MRKELYNLNSGTEGRMQCNLAYYGTTNARMVNATVFYILKNRKVVSWAVVYNPIRYYGVYSKRLEMDIFTKSSERGKGYGNAVAETVRDEFKNRKISACKTMSTVYKRNGI